MWISREDRPTRCQLILLQATSFCVSHALSHNKHHSPSKPCTNLPLLQNMSPSLLISTVTSGFMYGHDSASLPLQRRDTPPRYPMRSTDDVLHAQPSSDNTESQRRMPHRGVTQSTRLNKLAIPGQKLSNPAQDAAVFNQLPLSSTQFDLLMRCCTAHSA